MPIVSALSPEVVDPRRLMLENEIYLDWGPGFQMWHNQYWSGNQSPPVTVDSPVLIELFLKKKNAWSIMPKSVAVHLSDSRIKISQFSPGAYHRMIYLIMHQEKTTHVHAVDQFIAELISYIHNSDIILPM